MTTDRTWDDETLRAFATAEKAGLLGELSLADWDALPEDLCRDHELDRGRLVTRQSGSVGHQSASKRLTFALESAARKAVVRGAHPCLKTLQDLDVVLWDVPATVRRPDVLVFRCLQPGERRVRADDVLLVVEIVSPASVADDTGKDDRRRGFESKMTQYALAGIETYIVVFLRPDDSAIHRIQEWRLVAALGEYQLRRETVNHLDEYALNLRVPFDADIPYLDLDF